MLTERCGDVTPTEKDIKVVLTELGTPNELYEKYNPDSDKCLIGSPYYSTYKYVLKIVLAGSALGISIATLLDAITNSFTVSSGNSATGIVNFFIEFFTELLFSVPSVLLTAFGFVTIIFAIFYHKGIKIDSTDKLDELPAVPKNKEKISKGDSIVGIILSVVFLCVFLIAPQVICVIITDPFEMIPIFNTEVVKSLWYFIVAFAVVGIIREIVKLIEGRYNKKVMIATIGTNIVSALLSTLWLLRDNIINPEFVSSISRIFDGKEDFIIAIFSNFNVFFLAVIIMALLIDTIVTVVKTFRK